jgi:biopolymer transport protein ExbB/TolQ
MLLFPLLVKLAHAQEEAHSFSLGGMWSDAGWIARGVIVTLAAMLILTIAVAIDRQIAFARARSQSMRLRNEIVGPLQTGDVATAHRVCQDQQFKAGYLTNLLRVGLKELDDAGGADKFAVDNAKRAVEKAHAEELAKLQRGMPILATVASTAPFVGLFGTTFGVINAFAGMASAGSGLAAISAGISEALITTGIGIGVAVIGVWAFNYFNHRIAKVTDELNSAEADFLAWAAKLSQGQVGRGAAK